MSKHPFPTKGQIEIIKPIVGCSLITVHCKPSDYRKLATVQNQPLDQPLDQPLETESSDTVLEDLNTVSPVDCFYNFSVVINQTSFQKFSPRGLNTGVRKMPHSARSPGFVPADQTVEIESNQHRVSFTFKTEPTIDNISLNEMGKSILKKSRFCEN